MAVIRIKVPTNVRKIWVNVTCQECGNNYNIQMKGSPTRKNCPFCNDGTFRFILHPSVGWLEIEAEFLGSNWVPVPYLIRSTDVEIEVDEK